MKGLKNDYNFAKRITTKCEIFLKPACCSQFYMWNTPETRCSQFYMWNTPKSCSHFYMGNTPKTCSQFHMWNTPKTCSQFYMWNTSKTCCSQFYMWYTPRTWCSQFYMWNTPQNSPSARTSTGVCLPPKLQAPVYDILPPNTAKVDYAIGFENLSANRQVLFLFLFCVCAQIAVSL